MSDEEDRDYEEEEALATDDDESASERELDDDDEDDDEVEDVVKKRRKKAANPFIIGEADVVEGDDEDDDEDDEAEEGYKELAHEIENRDVGPSARALDSRRRLEELEGMNEDEINEYYKRRYQAAEGSGFMDGGGDHMADELTQKGLLPNVQDPNLWVVKCRMGEERATALQLMRKFIAFQCTDNPIQIKSVVVKDGLKGYIYVEAFKQTHVKQAIENVGNLAMGKWQQKMVPINEMPDVLRVVREVGRLMEKQWVRLKKTMFRDDLAQIVRVIPAQNMVELKLIPRIDYHRKRGELRTKNEAEKRKFVKPPLKLFDVAAIRAIGGQPTMEGDFWIFEGNRYNRHGFLYKLFPLSSVVSEGVKPSLQELERFGEQTDSRMGVERGPSQEVIDLLPDVQVSEDQLAHQLYPGDNVEVTSTALKHLLGRVISVDGQKVSIMPKHEDLKDVLVFQMHELRKHFRVGDHVKVCAGQHEGDTGLIVRVEDNTVIIFSDLSLHEVKALIRDVRLCPDKASGVDSLGQFQIGDLVQLDNHTCGAIVRLERDALLVLTMHGKTQHLRHQQIVRKRDSRSAIALDKDNNYLQIRDIVNVVDGPHSGKQGEIKHMYRGFAFVHSKRYTENAGMFVCKSRHLSLAGGARPVSAMLGMNAQSGMMSPRIHSPQHPSQSPVSSIGRGRSMRDRSVIGCNVQITQGPYKGTQGIVKDATDTIVKVELHNEYKTIGVDRTRIKVVGQAKPSGMTVYERTPGRTPLHAAGNQTPMYGAGSKTPMYTMGAATPSGAGGMTPAYGMQTPLHDAGGSVWEANTPRHDNWLDYDDDGPSPQTSQIQSPQSHASTGIGPGPSPAPLGFSPMTPGTQLGPSSVRGPDSVGSFSGSSSVADVNSVDAFSPVMGAMGLSDWWSPDLEVRITSNYVDSGLVGKTGVIRGVSGNVAAVYLPDADRTVNTRIHEIEPVTPERKDQIKILFGEHRDMTGVLLSVDGGEGILRLDDVKSDIIMVPVSHLCKLFQEGTAGAPVASPFAEHVAGDSYEADDDGSVSMSSRGSDYHRTPQHLAFSPASR